MSFAITQTEEAKQAEAEKNKKFLDGAIEDATKEVMKRASTDDRALEQLATESEAKTFWDNSKKLRDEFGRLEAFLPYWRALRAKLPSFYGFGRQRKKKSA